MSTLVKLFSRQTETRGWLKATEGFTRKVYVHLDAAIARGDATEAAELQRAVTPTRRRFTLELPVGGPRSAIQMEFTTDGRRPEFLGAKYYLVGEWDKRITLSKQATPGLWRLVEEYRHLIVRAAR